MKTYEPAQIRNVGLYGHQGAGKTTIGEAICFLGKSSTRLCSVAEGNSNFDFEAEEVRRQSTISTTVGYGEWKKHLINVVDNPGDTNFWAESVLSLVAADLGVIAVSAVDGVQVGTEKAYKLLSEAGIPRVIFISKMDKERADFDKTLAQLNDAFGVAVVPLAIPIGAENGFSGVVDLLAQKAVTWSGPGEATLGDVPADMADTVARLREPLIEKLAEQDDELMEKYFAEEDLSPEDLKKAMTIGMKTGDVVPVIAGNGVATSGVDVLLDLLTSYGPTPLDRKTFKLSKGESEEKVEPVGDGSFLGYVFKTIVDVQTGKITLIRVISGSLNPDTNFANQDTGNQERFGQIFKLLGKKQTGTAQAVTGDIVAMVKLKETRTGHTVAADKSTGKLVTAALPDKCMVLAVKPKSQGDEDKVSSAVQKIIDEDIGLALARDDEAKDLLLEGLGQIHIEIAVEKMKRKYGVEVLIKPRRVPYRETIRGSANKVEGKHKKQTGGHGQFAVCFIDLEALPRGSGFVFEDKIFGGSIPKQYIPSVEKGVRDAMTKGIVSGYPAVDFKVRLIDGKYHDVDSDNRSFELAGSRAFKEAFKMCKPVILEPIMNMTVMIPEDNLGDIMGDVSSRRGRVQGMEAAGGQQVVKAKVPMAEVLTYASDLRSMTSDRGSFTMELASYEEMPANLTEKLIQEAQLDDDDE